MTGTGLRSIAALFGCAFLAGCALDPEPYSRDQIIDFAVRDQEIIAASQNPITKPLSLAEATARALKFNLEHRVDLMSEALSSESFELTKFDMLPILAAEAGVTARDEFNASSSESLLTRLQSLEPSFSEDKTLYTASARFSWNILDFGISYLQAKQESDRYLIAGLARQEAMRDLALQVRVAYWRAAALQRVSADVDDLLSRADAARADLENVRAERLRAPLDTLEEIRNLAEIVQQLEALQQTVNAAMIDLAALINVAPGTQIPLAVPDDLPPLPHVTQPMENLELLALANSADYSAEIYNLRIDQREARKSILRLLPGVELFAATNYDSNSFLVFNHWNEAGARVTWNIMRLLAADQITDQNDARKLLTEARRLSANMGTITRVHRARAEYENALARLGRAADIDDIDGEIQQLTGQAARAQATSGSVQLRNEVRALRSSVARMLAYAEAQTAWGGLLDSLSLSPAPMDYQLRPLDELAAMIHGAYQRWQRGTFPDPDDIVDLTRLEGDLS